MGSNRFTIGLLCVVLYSLRSDATNVGSPPPSSSMGMVEAPISSSSIFSDYSWEMNGSSERPITSALLAARENKSSVVTPKAFNDPFKLMGEDNILGPPRRRKVIRRTRRRRIKKLKSTTESSQNMDMTEESESDMGGSSISTSTSTENVRKVDGIEATPMRLEVVPIDFDQSLPEDVSVSLPSPSPRPAPTKLPDPIFRSGHYTRHQRNRKGSPKANLWRNANFSIELFDTDSTVEEGNNNVDKRESNIRNKTKNNFNMFTLKPTSLSNLSEMNTDESTNPFINTSSPISTELQNSLQFTLQVLHPLLNSDSVLSEKEPKITEDKTVAVTHSLSNTVAETPVAPDLRFLPTHLRKSHPLLSDDSLLNSYSASKTGPRVVVHGMHSINNGHRDIYSTTGTGTDNTEESFRNRGRFQTISSSTTSTTTKGSVPSSTTTFGTSERTTPTTVRTSEVPIPQQPAKARPTPESFGNVHLEPLGNLKITELVYPIVAQKGVGLGSSSTIKPKYSSETTADTTSSISASTTSSVRPPSIYDLESYDQRVPPLVLLGSDSSISELGIQSKGTPEGPPAFDDLLLEELVKGFEPPTTTTPGPTTTTQRTTTTTPRPLTTTTRPPIITTKLTTTEASKGEDDETRQLLQLLNLLQQPQQTTEAITSTSTLSAPGVEKLDEELLKHLALLDTLLSPTAKTMLKEAVDAGTTEKIKNAKNPSPGGEGLSDADLKAIYMLLDAMSSTTPRPATTTTTTTPKPTMHPALQGMLAMLNNPWSDIQKMRAQQAQPQPTFSVPEPPKPVPTTSSLDLLSQLFNLNPQKPKANQNADSGLGALFGNLLPKRQPTNREATSGSNQLLNFFQPDVPVSTPPPAPYYWFDVNAFLGGNDPNSGGMSGFRPKMGNRDYFLKVRKRRDSMERYY